MKHLMVALMGLSMLMAVQINAADAGAEVVSHDPATVATILQELAAKNIQNIVLDEDGNVSFFSRGSTGRAVGSTLVAIPIMVTSLVVLVTILESMMINQRLTSVADRFPLQLHLGMLAGIIGLLVYATNQISIGYNIICKRGRWLPAVLTLNEHGIALNQKTYACACRTKHFVLWKKIQKTGIEYVGMDGIFADLKTQPIADFVESAAKRATFKAQMADDCRERRIMPDRVFIKLQLDDGTTVTIPAMIPGIALTPERFHTVIRACSAAVRGVMPKELPAAYNTDLAVCGCCTLRDLCEDTIAGRRPTAE